MENMQKYWECGDLAKVMYRRHYPIGTVSGIRKAIIAGHITPTGRTVGRGTYVWSDEDAQAFLAEQEQRKKAREAARPELRRRPRRK
jgi:hypothetical protein